MMDSPSGQVHIDFGWTDDAIFYIFQEVWCRLCLLFGREAASPRPQPESMEIHDAYLRALLPSSIADVFDSADCVEDQPEPFEVGARYSRPWMLEDITFSLITVEYYLVPLEVELDPRRCRITLEVDCWPFGGVACLLALVEGFGFWLHGFDEGFGFNSRADLDAGRRKGGLCSVEEGSPTDR